MSPGIKISNTVVKNPNCFHAADQLLSIHNSHNFVVYIVYRNCFYRGLRSFGALGAKLENKV